MGTTIDPDDPRLGRAGEGMNEVYLVLSEQERAKGFVRPLRRGYVHVGRAVCGTPIYDPEDRELPEGKTAWICSGLPGHEGECDSWLPVSAEELARFTDRGYLGGCDQTTYMGQEIAETYARNPAFYGATYCGGCKTHLPVGAYGEFVWADGAGEVIPLWVGT
jgi:hypothetical protein